MNNINYVGMYDIGDEEFTLGKENTVEVPETGDILTDRPGPENDPKLFRQKSFKMAQRTRSSHSD